MRFTTKSSRSVSFITTSWLIGFGCSVDCLRVSIVTGSTGSAIGSTTVYAIILACALALYSASVLGAITSRGVVSVFRSGKDGSLGITPSCGITAFVSIKHNQYAREIRQFPCSVSIYFKVCGSFKLSRISASCSNCVHSALFFFLWRMDCVYYRLVVLHHQNHSFFMTCVCET